MDGDEIISSISSIYESLLISSGLRQHMVRVAAVGELICENWSSGIRISRTDIIATLLIHDLGNVVKFNFDELKFWYGQPKDEIDFWKEVKRDTIKKYGTSSDHEVTLQMARGLGVNARIMSLLEKMGFNNIDAVAASNDFDLKICLYADQRVGPSGIMSMSERFDDLRARYGFGDGWSDDKGRAIELQIFNNTCIKPEDINEDSARSAIARYSKRMKIR